MSTTDDFDPSLHLISDRELDLLVEAELEFLDGEEPGGERWEPTRLAC
jgi:hypothetical protein